MDRNSIYQQKYLKYKSKYTELKNNGLKGGAIPKIINKGRYMRNLKGGAEISLSDAGAIPSITGRDMSHITDYENKLAEVKTLLNAYKQHVTQIDAQDVIVVRNKCKKSLTGSVCQQVVLDNKLKALAISKGHALYTRWTTDRADIINTILDNFDKEGNLVPGADSALNSATWFNDLYKWTMLPVVRFVEKQAKFGGRPVMVKFQVDIRESSVRDAINDPRNVDLHAAITAALRGLTTRTFSRDVFDKVNSSKGRILTDDDIDKVCGSVENPRTLVQRVDTNQSQPLMDNGVVVRFYKDDDLTYELPSEENGDVDESSKPMVTGLTIIEAEGPWHLVTWIETSMMQAVYEAYHKWDLKKKAEKKINVEGATEEAFKKQTAIEYSTWLSTALLRCACSVAYTQILQSAGGPISALFTGRRTGGLPFLILQNLFFIDHFQQAMGPVPAVHTRGLFSHEGTPCLGTSSVDAQQYLDRLLTPPSDPSAPAPAPALKPVLNTAGTHAHELSMVLSVLYHELDVNKHGLPFSQVLGHYLYKELVLPKTKGPLPMLPDTLGTPSFVLAASLLTTDDGNLFLGGVGSGRQDSGNLVDFKDVMARIGYKAGCMASEIDDTLTLLQAFFLGYNTFGAGGFFGDSNKAWDSTGTNISMAVKVVRVICNLIEGTVPADFKEKSFPHISIDDNKCTGFPIKTGDASDMNDQEKIMLMSKFSVDKTLPVQKIRDMKEWAIERRARGYNTLMNQALLLLELQIPLSQIIGLNEDKTTLAINPFPETLALAGGSKKLLLKRK